MWSEFCRAFFTFCHILFPVCSFFYWLYFVSFACSPYHLSLLLFPPCLFFLFFSILSPCSHHFHSFPYYIVQETLWFGTQEMRGSPRVCDWNTGRVWFFCSLQHGEQRSLTKATPTYLHCHNSRGTEDPSWFRMDSFLTVFENSPWNLINISFLLQILRKLKETKFFLSRCYLIYNVSQVISVLERAKILKKSLSHCGRRNELELAVRFQTMGHLRCHCLSFASLFHHVLPSNGQVLICSIHHYLWRTYFVPLCQV